MLKLGGDLCCLPFSCWRDREWPSPGFGNEPVLGIPLKEIIGPGRSSSGSFPSEDQQVLHNGNGLQFGAWFLGVKA